MARGVTCTGCGASTPLPDDLRTPIFRCAYCATELATAAFAGRDAVAADEMRAFLAAVVANPHDVVAPPRFETTNDAVHRAACLRCGAPVEVPLELRAKVFTCGGCGVEQAIDAYITYDERFRLDMERQVAGNQRLAGLRSDGVACGRCGGHNPVPDDGSVQVLCRFCGAAILLGQHVDADAVARARLKHGVMAFRDDIMRAQQERDRKVLIASLIIAAVVGGGIVLANLVFSP